MAGGVNVALCWSRQVEAALTNDPTNEELLKLRDDLTVSEYSAHGLVVLLCRTITRDASPGSHPAVSRPATAGP